MSALPAETMSANGTDFVSWRHCDVHTRSTSNILSLCLSTLVICAWNAVHPNVPNPGMPRWRHHLARFFGFLIGLFLPGLLVLNALDQYMDSQELMRSMNDTPSESLSTIAYWTKLLKEMYPRVLTRSYWAEAYRPHVDTWQDRSQSQWTRAHAFYAVSGGFLARSIAGQFTYLTLRDITTLYEIEDMRPFFRVDDLDDHNKAGALAKALFCWQLLVFAINCIARRAEHLPLSLLEITTLAHSLCGLAAFALWWDKPHSVEEVVVVPIGSSNEERVRWRNPVYTEYFMLLGFWTLVDEGVSLVKGTIISLALAALYGLPHLLGLSTEFPTLVERRCWQVATAIIIGTPISLVLLGRVSWKHAGFLIKTAEILLMGVPIVYCIGSCFIIAESFRQLFALPSDAFLAPAFVCYLPRFS